MKPMFSKIATALDTTNQLPDQIGKSAYAMRKVGYDINKSLLLIATLLTAILIVLIGRN